MLKKYQFFVREKKYIVYELLGLKLFTCKNYFSVSFLGYFLFNYRFK